MPEKNKPGLDFRASSVVSAVKSKSLLALYEQQSGVFRSVNSTDCRQHFKINNIKKRYRYFYSSIQ